MEDKVFFVLLFITGTLCSKSCDIDFVDISNGKHLPNNGDIFFDGETYKRDEYVIEEENNIEYGCVCMKKTCMRKCCPFGKGFFPKKGCVEVPEPFNPEVWDDDRMIPNVNISGTFHIITGKPNCSSPEIRFMISTLESNCHLREDGQLHVIHEDDDEELLRPDKYCIDTFVSLDEGGNLTFKTDAIICIAPDEKQKPSIPSVIRKLISCVLILVTVAVYCWLPELRNLHGRALVAYLLCLFVSFIFLITIQIISQNDYVTKECCYFLTFVIYFFLLASFFWLNVISFDIWWTFSYRGKRGFFFEALSTNAKFGAYALYAFGIPALFTCIMAGLEFSGLPYHPFLPNIILQGCFLHGKSRLLYLIGPMLVLCLTNLVFFILTIIKIVRTMKQTALLNSRESRTTNDQLGENRERILLCSKLFVLMGLNWLSEVFIAQFNITSSFWWISVVYNELIGLIVFIFFVCKLKIFRLIKKRFGQHIRVSKSNVQTPTITERNSVSTRFETNSETVTVNCTVKEKNNV